MYQLSGEEGFSFIELLVALAILTVVIVSSASVFTNSYVSIYDAGERSRALGVAQNIIEKLNLKSPEQLASCPFFQEGTANSYRWQRYLEPVKINVAGEEIPGIKISVFVFYREPDKKVMLTTFARGGGS